MNISVWMWVRLDLLLNGVREGSDQAAFFVGRVQEGEFRVHKAIGVLLRCHCCRGPDRNGC